MTIDTVEYAERLPRVRAGMAERSYGALVVTDPANLYYLTGYNAWSFYTPQCLVVPAEGEPHLFARAMDAAGAAFTCNLPREQVHGYPEELVHRPDVHPFDWIAAAARELVPAGEPRSGSRPTRTSSHRAASSPSAAACRRSGWSTPPSW